MKANRKNLIFALTFLLLGLFTAVLAPILSQSQFLFWTLVIATIVYLISGFFFLFEYLRIKKLLNK